MAELDTFETRFAAACRRYLDEVPTEVDAAEVARMVVVQGPVRRVRWTATLRTSPALTWLVLLALVLTALGAAAFVGSQPRPVPAVVPPVGQVYECPPGSTPDKLGPVDQAPPDGAAIAFDRHAGRLVAVGVTNSMRPTVETWTFDVCTNTWMRMHPNREPPLFNNGQLVYDADSDVTIGILFGKVWAYDLQANTWTEKSSAWLAADCCAVLLAYDPVSGLVVAATRDVTDPSNPVELWDYDVESDTWTPIHQANGPADWGMHAYDASVDRMIVYAFGGDDALEPETWLLDLRTGRWSRSAAETPDVPRGMGAWAGLAYDEAAERTVVISRGTPVTDRLATYDATEDRWEILTEAGPAEEWWGLDVYDPVNRRLVGGPVGGGTVVAFDLASRQWTVLAP